MDSDEINMMLKLMEYDYLSEAQERYIMSFERQFRRKGSLSDDQCDTLKDIFDQAAGKVEWSR